MIYISWGNYSDWDPQRRLRELGRISEGGRGNGRLNQVRCYLRWVKKAVEQLKKQIGVKKRMERWLVCKVWVPKSRNSLTWELSRNANYQAPPQTNWVRISGGGPSNLFSSPPGASAAYLSEGARSAGAERGRQAGKNAASEPSCPGPNPCVLVTCWVSLSELLSLGLSFFIPIIIVSNSWYYT